MAEAKTITPEIARKPIVAVGSGSIQATAARAGGIFSRQSLTRALAEGGGYRRLYSRRDRAANALIAERLNTIVHNIGSALQTRSGATMYRRERR
jgi:hypothetical protein